MDTQENVKQVETPKSIQQQTPQVLPPQSEQQLLSPAQKFAQEQQKKREAERKKGAWYGAIFLLPFLFYSIISTFLMYDNFAGILVPVETLLTVGMIGFVLKKKNLPLKAKSIPLMLVMLLLGISCTLTTSTMIFWNHVVSFCILILFLLENFCETKTWEFSNYIREFFTTIGKSISNMMDVYSDTVSYAKSPKKKEATTKTYIGIGVLICIPLLLIVLALLASADAVFKTGLEAIIPEEITFDFVCGVILFFLVVMMFSYAGMKYFYFRTTDVAGNEIVKKEPLVGITILIPMLLVYGIFCGIQVYYLFLGNGVLPEGYTYAKYAREGFFELLAVSFINLVLILLFQWLFKESNILKVLLLLTSVATYVMGTSSAYRMVLYVKAYNLSKMRLFVLWALILLGIFMLGMMAKIFFKGFPLFTYGLYVFCVCFLVISFARPDYQVAKYNLNNVNAENRLDKSYISYELSMDAAPAIAEYVKEKPSEETIQMVENYKSAVGLTEWIDYDYQKGKDIYEDTKAPSWRKFNFSDYFARKAFEQ